MSKVIFKINGKEVTPAQFRAYKMPRLARAAGINPCYSDTRPGKSLAMGCHFKEIDLMNKTLHEHGIVGVHYEPDKHGGKCVITNNSSKTGRRKWMKIYGSMVGAGSFHDEDSYD